MAKVETLGERRKALNKMKKENRELVRWQSESQKTNFLVRGETIGQRSKKKRPPKK